MTTIAALSQKQKPSYAKLLAASTILVLADRKSWQDRLRSLFPGYFTLPFSSPHEELWAWVDDITADNTPRPFIAIWPRNRGKSTHAEAIAVDLGSREIRRYCWYVCETQDQADKHILSIRYMMESDQMTIHYPRIGQPRITKTGGRVWRRNLLVTDLGFSVEAIGLDKAVRGGKIESQRPDLIIFDDVDGKHDTENATDKKQETITTSILPAAAHNAAVMFCQNLIHRGSIAHRLSKQPGTDGAADYLANRIISGPFPALEGLKYNYRPQPDGTLRWVILEGVSLWEGFTREICEGELNRVGPTSFNLESQHEIDADNPNALLTTDILDATRVSSHPDLVRLLVAVDPTGGAGQCGIIAGGVGYIGRERHGFTIADYSTPYGASANEWATAALRCYHAVGADAIVVEKNFGGDMVRNTIRTAELRDDDDKLILGGKNVKVIEVNASRGKEVRAQPVASLFELGKAHHVGHFPELEKQWTQWEPGDKPSPDRLDSEVWLYSDPQMGLIDEPATVRIVTQATSLFGARDHADRNGRARRNGRQRR